MFSVYRVILLVYHDLKIYFQIKFLKWAQFTEQNMKINIQFHFSLTFSKIVEIKTYHYVHKFPRDSFDRTHNYQINSPNSHRVQSKQIYTVHSVFDKIDDVILVKNLEPYDTKVNSIKGYQNYLRNCKLFITLNGN